MQQLQLTLTATIGLLLAASLPAAAQSNSLESLPAATQEEISRVCLPVQFREGAGAYRNCVQSELSLRSNGGTTALGQLSFDDKYAVQQACAKAGGQSSESYQSCVSNQISELNQIAAPSLNELSEDELYVVQQSCFTAQSKEGAASYRRCLNDEVQSLRNIPAVDTSNLNMLKKNALQLRCSSNSSNAVQYRQCVADQYESIAGTEPRFLPTGSATSVAAQTGTDLDSPVSNESTEAVAQNSDPAPVETLAVEQPAPTEVAALSSDPSDSESAVILPENIAPPADSSDRGGATVARVTVAQSNLEQLSPEQSNPEELNPEKPNPEKLNQDQSILNQSNDAQSTAEPLPTPATQTVEATVITAASPNEPLTDAGNDTLSESTENTVSSANSRIISRPNLVETLEVNSQADAENDTPIEDTSNATATEPQNIEPQQKLSEQWQKFLGLLSSMDAIGWLLIAGVLALPALLLGFFSMIRGFRKSTPAMPDYTPMHDDRVEPGLATRRLRHEQDAATLFDDDFAADHDAVTRIANKSEQQHAAHHQRVAANGASPRAANTYSSADYQTSANGTLADHYGEQWQSAFGNWLMKQPEDDRMEACVEFLIYWVAYGDDRYQPDLKQRLFTGTDLSSHDQIKRWVLKQDVFAFSDVIAWLRNNATQKQLDQCVALLMALLVTEHSITPVQNTMLRFLADAFSIGKNQLEQRFDKAFGHPMPPVPRTDKYAWWAKQKPEFMQRWEARFMATRAENEQMIARLGLTSNYDEAQVINAFRRAARRCHPDRFTELGDRERALAEQQFIKFEQARDKLLGVSV